MSTHWKKLTNPEYLGAYSLEDGKDLNITITKVVREMVNGTGGKKEECTVAHLKGQKPIILNSTNCKAITKLAGSPYIENWAGLTITVFIAHIKAFGEDNVECLRIRPTKPKAELPQLTPDHKRWDGAKKALEAGNTSLEDIKKAFTITPQNESLLCENLK